MPEIRLSETARADLADIDAFGVGRFGENAADAYQRGIGDALERLRVFPNLGESRPDYGLDIRCMVHRSHRIVYRVADDEVIIARILHYSRDVSRHLPE